MPVKNTELTHVVVIGASAGGLEAIKDFLEHLPLHSGMALVVAQHLSPEHPSQLADLLRRSTQMNVVVATDAMALQSAQVVVIPANSDAAFTGDLLSLQPPEPRFGPCPSLDRLFDSLATHWAERGVGVLLSGTGSDGACGLRAVGAAGGLTLVQSPESARFAGMPRAAIALGNVDLVANPATLAARLSAWLSTAIKQPGLLESEKMPLLLAGVAAQLKQRTGVDFSQYKESTLRRQVLRRMAISNTESLEDYISLLANDDQEADLLLRNLLVNVTSFFRNPDSFAALARHLETLLDQQPAGERLRIWVPGCASGEEAYSLGMMVSEVMGHPQDLSQRLKIFATDLDEQNLAIGRRGSYPISALKQIPDRLAERFVIAHETDFEFNKQLRSSLVFARHNVSEDPPFPAIDLISCRNALIYFTAPLQERVIDLFGFSLRSGGLLFLGSSESLGRNESFAILSPLHRIYQRNHQGRTRLSLPRAMQQPSAPNRPARMSVAGRETAADQHIRLLEALIRCVAHPCLVVDENHDLVEVVGDVSSYCRIPEGRVTAEVGSFLRHELQPEAKALLLLVRADRSSARSGTLQLADRQDCLRLEAAPLQVGDRELTVLSFIPERLDPAAARSGLGGSERDAAFGREIERLERELLSSQDSLRRSMAELEQANEELEASSEELQASSEELQSSNEELEASNEELQATNEELAGLNQQLRSRSEELQSLNNDLENIQSSLSQGMVIVDRNLRVTRFSPLAVRVFGLVESDLGQPLLGVPTTVPLSGLRDALLGVLGGEPRRSIEASSEDVAYLAQIMPYRDRDGANLGAIISLTDVSELVALRRSAESSLREFAGLADALEQVVWKRDQRMERYLYISPRITRLGGWTPEAIGQSAALLDDAIHPEDRAAVQAARSQAESGWRVTYRLATLTRGERMVEEVATALNDAHDQGFVGTMADVTEQNRHDEQSRLLAAGFETLATAISTAVLVLDGALGLIYANPHFAAMVAAADRDPSEPALTESLLVGLQIEPDPSLPWDGPARPLRDLAREVRRLGQPFLSQSVSLRLEKRWLGCFRLEMLPISQAASLGLIVRLDLLPA